MAPLSASSGARDHQKTARKPPENRQKPLPCSLCHFWRFSGGFGVLNPPPEAPRGAAFGVFRRPRPSENCLKTARKPPETTALFFAPFLAVFWRIWGPLSATGGVRGAPLLTLSGARDHLKPPENRQETASNHHLVSSVSSGGFLAVLGHAFRLWRRPEAPPLASFDLSGARNH